MSDNRLPNGDYQRIVSTLRDRGEMLSGGNLSNADQVNTSGLIKALNPSVNPGGSNVPFITSLENRLDKY